jgi:hypothetical protein
MMSRCQSITSKTVKNQKSIGDENKGIQQNLQEIKTTEDEDKNRMVDEVK